MNLVVAVVADDTNARCEALLDELETAKVEREGVTIHTAGGQFTVEVLDVQEAPA